MLPSVVPHRSLPVLGIAPRIEPRTVRISLTDRCDLACMYCRPSRSDGYLERRLGDDAWRAMVRALVQKGVRRFRITGGEPLLHPRVTELVAYVASLGVEDLALTTNATQLEPLARPLREAGLRRLTVSLDSLVPERFWRITRGGKLERVLAGIEAARRMGFEELKVNTVVLRDENDDELASIVEWAWARGIVPRFIEVMRVGEGANLPASTLVGHDEMRQRLASLLVDEAGTRDLHRGPARYVSSRHDPRLRVGFITGTTDTYCSTCDRLRVASDGTLRPCLATNDGVAAMDLAQRGDVDGLAQAIGEAWALKPDGQTWKGCTEDTAAEVSMRAIGG
jgi:cyclic pyranopterin phosphate synthase